MICRTINPSPIFLSQFTALRREPARPVGQREEGFEKHFDNETLLYDVFFYGDAVVGIGPPLLNLKTPAKQFLCKIADERVTLGSQDIDIVSRWVFSPGSMRNWFRVTGGWPRYFNPFSHERGKGSEAFHRQGLEINFEGRDSPAIDIGSDCRDLFAGKRCLLTKSKDNDLSWVEYWVTHHVQHHGANAVLFYDNASSKYTAADVLNTLQRISGLELAVVVSWPFKWGVSGHRTGLWDSCFSQNGILEHARWRFLELAASVLSVDVDELVVGDGSVFALAEGEYSGGISIGGNWIENVVASPQGLKDRVPHHSDFKFYNPNSDKAEPKWCTVPKKNRRDLRWRVHNVRPYAETSAVCLKHFRGISTSWKYDRNVQEFDPRKFVVDEAVERLVYKPR